jgi:hypothetical protein
MGEGISTDLGQSYRRGILRGSGDRGGEKSKGSQASEQTPSAASTQNSIHRDLILQCGK